MPPSEPPSVVTPGCLHRTTDDGVCDQCGADHLPLAWNCPNCGWRRGRVDDEPGVRMFYLAVVCAQHRDEEPG